MNRFLSTSPLATLCAVLLFLAPGCSNFNGTRLEPVLGGDVNLVRLGDKVAETLIEQSLPPLLPRQPSQPVLIATLVNNDDLADTSTFGRSFQNNIVAGFVDRGYTVKEVKLRRDMLVEREKGEFMLTRDLREMASKQNAQAIVVGTYAMANRVMYLSVRLVNPMDQAIRAAYEDRLTLDENSLKMLGCSSPRCSELRYDTKKTKSECGESGQICPPSESTLDRVLY